MNISENNNAIFRKGEKASSDYFTGTAWVNMLVPKGNIYDCPMLAWYRMLNSVYPLQLLK